MGVSSHLAEECVVHAPDGAHVRVVQPRPVAHQLYEGLTTGRRSTPSINLLQTSSQSCFFFCLSSIYPALPVTVGVKRYLVLFGDVEKFLRLHRLVHQLLVASAVVQGKQEELRGETGRRVTTSRNGDEGFRGEGGKNYPVLVGRHRVHGYGLPRQVGRKDLVARGGVQT